MQKKLSLFITTLLLVFSTVPTKADDGNSTLIYINPIGSILGMLDFGADFAVSDNFSVGPEIFILNTNLKSGLEQIEITGTGFGLKGSWQLSDRKTIGGGWILSGMAGYFPKVTNARTLVLNNVSGNKHTGDTSYALLYSTIGYRWIWGVFAMKLAGGLGYNTMPDKQTLVYEAPGTRSEYEYDVKNGVVGVGEFGIGFVF